MFRKPHHFFVSPTRYKNNYLDEDADYFLNIDSYKRPLCHRVQNKVVVEVQADHDGIFKGQVRGPFYKTVHDVLQKALNEDPGLMYGNSYTKCTYVICQG